MNEFVLDASALLTVFNEEPGAGRVIDVIRTAAICSVNLAEVATKLQERGMHDDRVRANIDALEVTVVPFDAGLAIDAGLLRATTRAAGLSLGDRACLALARSFGATALTTDRAWRQLEIGIPIELAR